MTTSVITIDGPAGVGKSTLAKALAARLEFDYLDTGAMFRAVALGLLRSGIDPAGLAPDAELPSIHIEMRPPKVFLNGEDVSQAIRAPDVSAASSIVAVNPAVRHRLAEEQRRFAEGRRVVCEGRDQGTIVFPNAIRKFFLTASPETRAERRLLERQAKGEIVEFETILAEQKIRDERDASRDLAPMKPADDAILVDTTGLAIDEVLALLLKEIPT